MYDEETYFADNEDSGENFSKKAQKGEQNGKQRKGKRIDKNTDEAKAKRRKTDLSKCAPKTCSHH